MFSSIQLQTGLLTGWPCIRLPIACLLALICLLGSPANLLAQATPELPRTEYYVARDLYDAGNINEATEGFRVAVNRGHQLKGQRWIDCVPPLVMLGECYFQQGAIAQALEQYDAALMVTLTYPNWADAMRAPESPQELPSDAKSISWFKLNRVAGLVRVPHVMHVSVDPTQARTKDGVLVTGGSAIMRLDVSEVLRCQAIALRRRVELLGPMAPYSPLTAPIVQAFARAPQHDSRWIQTAWKSLHGLALHAAGNRQQAATQLALGISLDNKFDYFLTAPTLLSLAALDIEQGNEAQAIARLTDATIRAAQFEQADTLAECFTVLGQVACAGRRTDLLTPLQSAVVWCQNYSIMSYLAACGALCELSAVAGNVALHEATAKQMLTLLGGQGRGKDVALPRVQAQLGYAMARAAAAQNRLPLAEQQLEQSLSLLRGSAMTGAATPRVFQTQLTLELASSGKMPVADADQIFRSLLCDPVSAQWRRWPLECMLSISSTHLPAYEKWLELAHRRSEADETIARMDAVQRQRYYELLPMGGRLLAARLAINSDRNNWSAEASQAIEPILKAMPMAKTIPATLREQFEALDREPMITDDRNLSADAKKRIADVVKLSEAEENVVMSLALQRSSLPRHWPMPASLESLQQSLNDRDCMLAFVHTKSTIYGAAISKNKQHVWNVAESPAIDAKVALLLTQIGVSGAPNLDMTAANLPWRTTAVELSKLLIPTEAKQLIAASNRVIIVPSGNLWYLPFDMLPAGDADARSTLLNKHPICYLPTMSMLPWLRQPAPKVRTSLGLYSAFFTTDRSLNQSWCAKIANDSPQTQRLDLQQKVALSSPSWLRWHADQIWVASDLPMAKTPWELRVLPLEPGRDNALANWMQSPLRVPSRLFLPGLQSSAQRIELTGGNELFLPACTFLTSGVRSTWMSRWKVGGRSTHTALSRVMEELEYESPSAAWQRAALALWAEKLPSSEEPCLPAAKGLPPTIDGSHPLFWSGYMMVGDYVMPE